MMMITNSNFSGVKVSSLRISTAFMFQHTTDNTLKREGGNMEGGDSSW